MRLPQPLVFAVPALVLGGCIPLCFNPAQCDPGQACVLRAPLQGLPSKPEEALGLCEDECTRDDQCRGGEACTDGACTSIGDEPCETANDCSTYGACANDGVFPFNVCMAECESADECRAGWACSDLAYFEVRSCIPVCTSDGDCRDGEVCQGYCVPAPVN